MSDKRRVGSGGRRWASTEDQSGVRPGPMATTVPTDIIERHLIETLTKGDNQWGRRHVLAWGGVYRSNSSEAPKILAREKALRLAIEGWALIGETHVRMYASHIGSDGFLGPAWKAMGQGLRTMLNGECGRFDCGTLDGLILNIAHACGVDLET